MRIKKWELALVAALLLAILFSGLLSPARELEDKLLRLHVVASSDSERDQGLKLAVRDRVLAELQASVSASADKPEAMKEISLRLPELKKAAEETLSSLGADFTVTVSLARECFPTVEYDTFRLPAGRYDSLRVTIGEGAGHNWWCVIFPPLCLDAASFGESGLGDGAIDVISGDSSGVQVRFKLLEWFGELKNLFSRPSG